VAPGTLDDPPRCSTPPSRASGRRGSTCGTSTSPRPGAAARVVKVLVPALEVEGMSYHRIGRRGVARLLARGDALVGRIADGAPPAGARRVPLPADDEAALGGPVWFDVAEAERRLGTLYALYREPGEHVLAFADAAPVAVPA
jgi:ribosomal protein S12 methylthiotransferase accessory factor